MKRLQLVPCALLILVGAVGLQLTGCNDGAKPNVEPTTRQTEAPTKPAASAEGESSHGHKDGQHGGTIVSLGGDSYHVEAVIAADGVIRLYTLGADETRVIDVEKQSLKGFVKTDGTADAQEITFDPTPQEGDANNRTSLFVGRVPAALAGRPLDVTIPNIRIDGERFRLAFTTTQHTSNSAEHAQHADSSSMPEKVSDSAERELYLTPGGHYTAEDIAANGRVIASEKFKGIKSDHNMNPQVGDKICPISGTKANPKFSWVIGGKSYQFCCPPCLDEFLTNAKSSTEPLPDPETFIKK